MPFKEYLATFEVKQPDPMDPAEMYHGTCGRYVCNIEDSDTLLDLYDAAGSHNCPGNSEAQGGELVQGDGTGFDARMFGGEPWDTYREQTDPDA